MDYNKGNQESNFIKILYLIPLVFFVVIITFLWRGLTLDPNIIPSALLNKPIPEFALMDVSDVKTKFTDKDLIGQVSLLNVWATWCTTCQAEHPYLMDLKLHNRIAIYGVDYKDNLVQSQKWLHQFGNPYQRVGFDNSGKTSIDLGVYGTPETFIVDKHSVIRYRLIGELTPQIWQRQLQPIISHLEEQS